MSDTFLISDLGLKRDIKHHDGPVGSCFLNSIGQLVHYVMNMLSFQIIALNCLVVEKRAYFFFLLEYSALVVFISPYDGIMLHLLMTVL
jgi:hypothetical protein